MQGYKEAGNTLVGIIGAREKALLILEDEMDALCERLLVTTDDGSYGMHGLVTDALPKLVEEQVHIDQVVAVGPLIMMRAVCDMTKLYEIPTRVTVGGETKFACVDGPHFDGHKVDFDELIQRNMMYARDERTSLLTSIRAR